MKKLLVTVNGIRFEVEVEVIEDDELSYQPSQGIIPVGSKPGEHLSSSHLNTLMRSPISRQSKTLTIDQKKLSSPINGKVIEIPFSVGQRVKENDVLFVLEAMKMKTNISSPVSSVIKTIEVKVGDIIEAGQLLMTFE